MADSIKLCLMNGIELCPVTMPGESLLTRARNELLALAAQSEPVVTDMVWIDSDQGWNASDLLRLLQHPTHVVGAPVVKKADGPPQWNVKALLDGANVDENGLCEVAGVGTGFLRMDRKAFMALWENSSSYEDAGKMCRMAFEVTVVNGKLTSEDMNACFALRKLGFHVYLDTQIVCAHVGYKTWAADFAKWLKASPE
jgi:hypothetical protein